MSASRNVTILTLFLLALATFSSATPTNIITDTTLGFYNSAIGNILDGSTGFPNSGDPTFPPIAPVPDLSAAAGILGNWLTNPGSLNANWSGPQAIPETWAVTTETAIVYSFTTSNVANIVGSFSVDNGIYVWLDGAYVFGAMAPGGGGLPFEYPNNALGTVGAGTHYLQVMREDHGGGTDFHIQVTSDAAAVPEPASLVMLGSGLLVFGRRFRRK